MKRVYIKDWFFKKMEAENRNMLLVYDICAVVKETEKAYLLMVEYSTIDGEYDGVKNFWCPKACTMTEEEYKEKQKAAQERFENGCRKYEELISFAKAQGIKGIRKGMKAATIKAKLVAAGIEY